jgi:hypothetical protein
LESGAAVNRYRSWFDSSPQDFDERNTMSEYVSWNDVKAKKAAIDSQRVADQQIAESRNKILGIKLGRHTSRFVLRTLQALKLYPKT